MKLELKVGTHGNSSLVELPKNKCGFITFIFNVNFGSLNTDFQINSSS